MSVILGLYCGHDSNACVLRDGEPVIHIESERITRRKHECGLIRRMVASALAAAHVSIESVDAIALGGTTVSTSIDSWPDLDGMIGAAALRSVQQLCVMHGAAGPCCGPSFQDTISVMGRQIPLHVVHHHVSHVALAYYTSPWVESTIMSWDGGGDGAYTLRCRGSGGRIMDMFYNPPDGRPNLSIGGVWTEVGTQYGLGVDHEGKIMGHASYGVPRPEQVAVARSWMEKYGEAGQVRPWSFASKTANLSDLRSQSSMDFSASLQRATEDLMLSMIANVRGPLVLAGGCAYNCVANGLIFKEHPDIYVPSCPHDGGLALGAALYLWHHVLGNPFRGRPNFTPYLGSGTWCASKDVAKSVVEDILAGRIVAWYDGPAESGKRALGARSILADPRNPAVKDLINDRVKHREWFRPFAPSVLPGRDEWCDGKVSPSPYMSFSCRVRDDWRGRIPGVVHVDGTCRPQIVDPTTNPVYYEIIRLFDQETGVPMILNTSFNVQEPIVDTPDQARATFGRTGIDVLYLHGERLAKD